VQAWRRLARSQFRLLGGGGGTLGALFIHFSAMRRLMPSACASSTHAYFV